MGVRQNRICLFPRRLLDYALGYALPNLWLLGIVQLLCLAIIGGLLSSGRQWRQGGVDDR
jgi:hypothetical protein